MKFPNALSHAFLIAAAAFAPGAAASTITFESGDGRRDRPAFTLEQVAASRSVGQAVLSPDRRTVVYTHVGRYFGHPLFPTFGEDSNLFLVDVATGERTRLTSGDDAKTYPAFSPDGSRIAYESEGDIWSVEIATGKARRLTTDWGTDRSPAWSPDGREIAFVSNRWGRSNLYVMSAEGERVALRRITPDGVNGTQPAWLRDGSALLFVAALDEHFYSRGIYRVPAAGGDPVRVTPADDARNGWPTPMPDGRRIAYFSDRGGFQNVWTMNLDGSDQRQLTRETQDQDYPENDYLQTMGLRFSPDGRRLLYFTNRLGNLDLKTIDLQTGEARFVENRDGAHHPVGWVDDRTVVFVYENYRQPPDL
ncbi:MAG: DPP IV N-terminal domain-containing protein [Steroidobacteraceae bacterium]|jgi:Tol biopolymer transport system component|nr:DPP IV N-terminal domain-containing protein [Steroidobacteraceae bacterium]